MRGGRNKFGPMYKRDRARRLQLLRQKQLTKAQLMGSVGVPHVPLGGGGHVHGHGHHGQGGNGANGPHHGPSLGGHPPGVTMLPGGGELSFLSGGGNAHHHGGNGAHHAAHPHATTATIFDGVKQELIQIPQLSSSTSSPDSSPSPGASIMSSTPAG